MSEPSLLIALVDNPWTHLSLLSLTLIPLARSRVFPRSSPATPETKSISPSAPEVKIKEPRASKSERPIESPRLVLKRRFPDSYFAPYSFPALVTMAVSIGCMLPATWGPAPQQSRVLSVGVPADFAGGASKENVRFARPPASVQSAPAAPTFATGRIQMTGASDVKIDQPAAVATGARPDQTYRQVPAAAAGNYLENRTHEHTPQALESLNSWVPTSSSGKAEIPAPQKEAGTWTAGVSPAGFSRSE